MGSGRESNVSRTGHSRRWGEETPVRRSRVALPIIGLACGGGGSVSIEKVLRRLAGVYWVYVNPATEMAYVEYASEQVSLGEIARAVESAGFRAVLPAIAPGETR